MHKFVKALFLVAGVLAVAASPAAAQGQNGRGEGKQSIGISYYKVPPGKQDEWLALYKKWHFPIMQYEIEHGAVGSEKIFASGSHAIEPSWDFAIIITGPAPGQGKKLDISRGDLIRKLYPDLKAYTEGEKQRWALTVGHWDEKLVELDPHEEPFSVYWPIGGDGKNDSK
jgi:hypothetical protein